MNTNKSPKWTDEVLARLRAEYPTTLNVTALAKDLGVHPERLREMAKRLGVKRDPAAMFAARSRGNKIGAAAPRRVPTVGLVAQAVANRSAIEIAWWGSA